MGNGLIPQPVTITDLVRTVVNEVRSISGSLRDHIREIVGLGPEVLKVDLYTFWAVVSAAGGIVPMAQPLKVSAGWAFEMTSIWGSIQDPVTNIVEYPKLTFNLRESGRNFDVFDYPINFSALVNTAGQGTPIEFPRGAYVFQPGSDLTPNFQAFATAGAVAGGPYLVCVFVAGNKIHVSESRT